MIRILSILIFLFIHLNINAQCINISGSQCLNENGLTNLILQPNELCGNTDLNAWNVTDPNNNSIFLDISPQGLIYVIAEEVGQYLISDGVGNSIIYDVLDMPSFSSTVLDAYYICEDSVIVEFEILPSNSSRVSPPTISHIT